MGLCASAEREDYEFINPYDGEKFLCFRHGEGTYQYNNGDTYKGEWKWDKKHGHGVYTHHKNGEMWVTLTIYFTSSSPIHKWVISNLIVNFSLTYVFTYRSRKLYSDHTVRSAMIMFKKLRLLLAAWIVNQNNCNWDIDKFIVHWYCVITDDAE